MLRVKIDTFSYQKTEILKQIDFSVKKGQNIAIIGESGCGKSTLLKLIYGLYDCDFGEIYYNETRVLGPKYNLVPGMDFIKYLAQDFDLMPYISVAENVGKYLSNVDFLAKQARIDELLSLVEMTEFKNTKAQFLSGGQMQRVALAKVLVQEPEILLLDEPFSHIDNFRKNNLRRKIFKYCKHKNITTIIASHDVNDFLSFADEIIVIKNGQIIQKANADVLFNSPENKYVASLIDEVSEIEINGELILAFPHQLKISENFDFEAKVIASYFKGNYFLVEANFNEKIIFFNAEKLLSKDDVVGLKFKVSS